MLASIVVYVLVGNYAGRKVAHVEDYYVAGRNAPTLFIIGTLIASYLSTNFFLGEVGIAYDSQAGPFLLFPPLASVGWIYGALYFGRYLRRSRALTVAEFFGQRFNSRRVQQAAGVTIVLGLGGYLLGVSQGAAVILEQLTPLSYVQALVVSWLGYTMFTMYAGSRGVIITDTLMFGLFTGAFFLAAAWILDLNGGWAATLEGLSRLESKPDLMSWHGQLGPDKEWQTPMDLLIWSLVLWVAWSVVQAVSPWQSSRYLIARNEQVVIRAGCIAMVILAVLQMVAYVPAISVNLFKEDIFPLEQTMIWTSLNLVPGWLGALILAGIMAAALSSASTFLSLVGFSMSNDIHPGRARSDADMLRFSRRMMLAVGSIALAVAMVAPVELFWLIYFVGTVYASSWGPVAFMSVWSRRITEAAAFWGMIAGFLGNVVPAFCDWMGWVDLPMILHPLLLGTVISLVTIWRISPRTEVTRAEHKYREALHVTPEDEKVCRHNLRWLPPALLGYGLVMAALLMAYYVRPYHAMRHGGGGGIEWLSGESLLVLSQIPLMALMAWMVRRELRRSYAGDPG